MVPSDLRNSLVMPGEDQCCCSKLCQDLSHPGVPHAASSSSKGAGGTLTVCPLHEQAGGDGREQDHADDVAPVILNETLELLDLLLNFVSLVLLPLCFGVQMQLVLICPGKNRKTGVILRFNQKGMARGPPDPCGGLQGPD